MTTTAAVSEKEQLERDIAQLVQDNPTPRCLGLPIDADLRHRLQAWAKERKKIAEKRERLEMILQEERIQAVMRELDELHPQKKIDCPLCLEEIPESARVLFVCCGQGTCNKCASDNLTRDPTIKINSCPLCRHKDCGGGGKERRNNILKFAQKGEAWAQTLMGDIYMGKDEDVFQKVDRPKAKEWYQKAMDQDFPLAIIRFAGMMNDENPPEYIEHMKRAAELGSGDAAHALVRRFWFGPDSSHKKTVYYGSIALASQNTTVFQCRDVEFISTAVGMSMIRTLETNRSDPFHAQWTHMYRAKHYLEIGARNDFDSLPLSHKTKLVASASYANTIMFLGAREYDRYSYEIPGYSWLPKLMYWGSKSHSPDIFTRVVSGPPDEHGGRETYCANCNIRSLPGSKFKQCVKCKAAWYCSKECQIESWKAGHKVDCKQRYLIDTV